MRRFCFLGGLSLSLLFACQVAPVSPSARPLVKPSATPTQTILPSASPSKTVTAIVIFSSPSAITTASPLPVGSVIDDAYNRTYHALELGQSFSTHLMHDEKHYYLLKTEPGQRYILKAFNDHHLQKLYFGSQSNVLLGSDSPENEIDMDFVAEEHAYYLILTSPESQDYALDFHLYDPNPTPTPTSRPDCDCYNERPTLNGKVFDDTNAPLDGVTIRARSLNSSVPFDAISTTSGGSYAFNNPPSGVEMEIMASRGGYSTRRQVVVLKSNKSGDPNANRYDFGTDGGGITFGVDYNALSDKPEVISVSPGQKAAGIDSKTQIVLKFSEPMDRSTVQENFEVLAFNSKKLTVDTSTAASTVKGSGDINLLTGTRIWDKDAFTISWNSDDSVATFTFKENDSLPTDKDITKIPDYQISLNRQDGAIKDKSGISRGSSEKKFKLTDRDFERSSRFSIKPDEKKPMLETLAVFNNVDLRDLSVNYSEAMQLQTLNNTFAGGLGGSIASAPAALSGSVTATQAAGNYLLTLKRAGLILQNRVSWASLGGEAMLDPANPRRVLLSNPALVFQSGDEVALEAATTILDPAGNSVDVSGNRLALIVGVP